MALLNSPSSFFLDAANIFIRLYFPGFLSSPNFELSASAIFFIKGSQQSFALTADSVSSMLLGQLEKIIFLI